jgi:prepilin-type N-terminal cleavage/methylation domain-containing protein
MNTWHPELCEYFFVRRPEVLRGRHSGFTLVELLVTLSIFSIVMAGVLAVYTNQVRHSTREYRLAESEMEAEIATNIIERDVMMAGYGLADDYDSLIFVSPPMPIGATDNIDPGATANPAGGTYPSTVLSGTDSLYMMGTALGMYSKTAQAWTYIQETSPLNFQEWADARENIQDGDRVVYIEPNTKTIVADGTTWRFTYPDVPDFPENQGKGVLLYGLTRPPGSGEDEVPRPYYIVQYRLGGSSSDRPDICSRGTRNLERVEISSGASIEPVLTCVRDFQAAFGIDTDGNGKIDAWDPVEPGRFQASEYDIKSLKKRIKLIKIFVLVQAGNRDPDYAYANPDDSENPGRICVGELRGGTCAPGRFITLTNDQRKYRWKVISLDITPRNLR